jgi:hypothetical protein
MQDSVEAKSKEAPLSLAAPTPTLLPAVVGRSHCRERLGASCSCHVDQSEQSRKIKKNKKKKNPAPILTRVESTGLWFMSVVMAQNSSFSS